MNKHLLSEYFQALEDTEVYVITRAQLQQALSDHLALSHFERLLNPALLPGLEPAIN